MLRGHLEEDRVCWYLKVTTREGGQGDEMTGTQGGQPRGGGGCAVVSN